MNNAKFYATTESEPNGLDTIMVTSAYNVRLPERVSHYVRERGAGQPIATAGGQRDSLRVAGPFATIEEARAEAGRRMGDVPA